MLKLKNASALFTICRNESFFLPMWLSYYRKHFEDKDIYILDHESTDGSTENIYNKILVSNNLTQDNDWLIKVTTDFQKKLLGMYKNVLFTNVDEFVVARQGLQKYIEKNTNEFVRCVGFEVLHMKNELPYDSNKKVLEQRNFWYKNTVYNKPLLSRLPLEWTGGWHNANNFRGEIDSELYLIHLHRMDFAMCLARHKKTSAEPIFRRDLEEKKWGWHHIIHDDEDFAKWFYCIDAAKILNAELSLDIFQKAKTMLFSDIYQRAVKLVEPIPTDLIII